MNDEVIGLLEKRIDSLLEGFQALKRENHTLREENQRLLMERQGFRSRVDAILAKLEEI